MVISDEIFYAKIIRDTDNRKQTSWIYLAICENILSTPSTPSEVAVACDSKGFYRFYTIIIIYNN